MPRVAILEYIHPSGINLLKNNSAFDFEIIENISKENLINKLPHFDAISLRVIKLDSDIISKCKNLKIISRHGVGYDNVDLNSLKSNNITLAITATANAISVAEHVMFMILNISKGIGMYDGAVREGQFLKKDRYGKTFELWNKNFLIVGFGRVGKILIKRCLGFEMKVYVYDPFVDEKTIKSFSGIKVKDFNRSLKDMDYISMHVPLTDKTRNLINLSNLKTMKKNSIIVNTSRGGIINEEDLNEALNKGFIFGAGLDVFAKEPPDTNNPLLKNKKVILSPHSSTFTEECTERMGKETIQNIIDFFENKLNQSMIVKL